MMTTTTPEGVRRGLVNRLVDHGLEESKAEWAIAGMAAALLAVEESGYSKAGRIQSLNRAVETFCRDVLGPAL